MIKEKDLRLDNLFRDREGKLCSVEEIKEDFNECNISAIHSALTTLPVNPIKTTEDEVRSLLREWEFVGFGTRIIFQHSEYSAIKIECCGDDRVAIFINDNLINFKEYIHELQNLVYYLTDGEVELTLKM